MRSNLFTKYPTETRFRFYSIFILTFIGSLIYTGFFAMPDHFKATAQNNAPELENALERFKRISASGDNLGGCPTIPINFGQTLSGSLAPGDCTDTETGQLADAYLFSGTAGQTISSTFASPQFDTYLFLFDLTGNIIAFNDNMDGSNSNSRIPPSGTLTLPSSGQFILFATSSLPSGRGNYTINLLTGLQAVCDFTLSPTSQFFQANGGSGSFSVTPNNQGCNWQAQSNVPWVTTTGSGTGTGTVNFNVAINDTAQGRGAVIMIGARNFSIHQNPLSCSYSRAPFDIQIPAFAGQYSFTLNASNSLCPTNVTTNNNWITIQNPTGTGTRTINYSVASNNIPVARNGTFFISNTTQFGILQWWRRTPFSFDSGAQANLSLYRPMGGLWIYKLNNYNTGEPSDTNQIYNFGLDSDKPVPADFDGDARTDFAVFRRGAWYIVETRNYTFRAAQFGADGDKPMPTDFDGDEKADFNVFRPTTGEWFRLNSTNGQFHAIRFGTSGDVPLMTDFNADGRSEISIYRPSNGAWYWLSNTDNSFNAVNFGLSTDIPIPADYDGDSKTDIAVYRPSQGNWYRLNSSDGQFVAINFGIGSDIPVPADYDSDGKTDIAVYRPTNGTWYRLRSRTGAFDAYNFGIVTDIPLPAAYQP